jgi:hypothetical protein
MKAADRYAKLAQSSTEEGTRSKAQGKECAEASFRQASSFFYLAAINSDLREAGSFLQKAIETGERGSINSDSLRGALILLKLERDSVNIQRLKEEIFPNLQSVFTYLGNLLNRANDIRTHEGRHRAEAFLEERAFAIGTPMYVPLLTTLIRWREEDALSLEASGKREEAVSLIDSAIKYARRIESSNLARELEERWLKR